LRKPLEYPHGTAVQITRECMMLSPMATAGCEYSCGNHGEKISYFPLPVPTSAMVKVLICTRQIWFRGGSGRGFVSSLKRFIH